MSLAHSRNLSVLLSALEPTPSPLSADVICEWAHCPSDLGWAPGSGWGREGTKGSIIGAFFFLPPWILIPDLPSFFSPEQSHPPPRSHFEVKRPLPVIRCFVEWYTSVSISQQNMSVSVQRSAKVGAPGLVNFIPAVAYHFCPRLPAAFTQPGAAT